MKREKLSDKTQKGLNYKHRILALFQFFSTVGLVLLLLGYSLISKKESPNDFNEWIEKIGSALIFDEASKKAVGVFASLLIYISIGLWMVGNIFGWLMFRFKNRNLFDQLFLVFLLIPIFSNIFALFAQLSTKKIEHTSSDFDKEAIIKDQTRIINANLNKAEKEKKERIAGGKPRDLKNKK